MEEQKKPGSLRNTAYPNELFEEVDDFVYISDPDSYALLYVNEYTRNACDISKKYRTQGLKCYAALYGRSEPCDFCPLKQKLAFDRDYTWEGFNSRTKRYTLNKDRMILWEDRDSHFQHGIDISEQKKIEDELQISEQRFNIAMDNSDRSLFEVDLMTHTEYHLRLNPPFDHLPKSIKNAPESLIEAGYIAPSSAQTLRDLYMKIFSGGAEASADVEIIGKDQTRTWCHLIMTTIFRNDGMPLRAVVVCENISSQKKLSIKYERSMEYQAFFLKDSLLFLDLDLTTNKVLSHQGMTWNALEDDKSVSEVIRSISDRYVQKRYREQFMHRFARMNLLSVAEEEDSLTLDHLFLSEENEIWVRTTASLSINPETGNVNCILMIKDIDEAKRHENDLIYQMQHDKLTGFYNPTGLAAKINDTLQTVHTDDYNALMLIELRNLSSLYSKYGSTMSNQYITGFSQKLKSMFRADDLIGHVGDNRYALYAQNLTSMSALSDLSNSLLNTLKNYFMGQDQIEINIGCSLFPFDGSSFEELYEHAEEALRNSMAQGAWTFACYQLPDMVNDETAALDLLAASTSEAERPDERRQTPKSAIGRYDNTLDELGRVAFKSMRTGKVKQFSFYTILTTVIVTIILFSTLMLGMNFLIPEVDVDNQVGVGMLWTILHMLLLILMWIRLLYLYQSSLSTDTLTGKNNRYYFINRAPQIYKKASHAYAIVTTNITNFKLYNSKYGQNAGDDILRRVHDTYAAALDKDEIISRLDADHYALLMSCDDKHRPVNERLLEIEEKIRGLCSEEGEDYHLRSTYGVCIVDNIMTPVEIMIDRADLAKSQITSKSKSKIGTYNEEFRTRIVREHNIEGMMRTALSHRDFLVYYQPVFDAKTLAISNVEALVRWNYQPEGLLLPEDFVPLFEQNGFIVQLDLYVFETLCKQIRKWLDNGLPAGITFSMNLSNVNLDIPDFLSVYKNILDKDQIPPWTI
ncbi:MAG: diguanylate cyclase, partial [Lachnospiraceae bacterium]|nr:diguanylate cyclase [Lachnospiraceae bacterium]